MSGPAHMGGTEGPVSSVGARALSPPALPRATSRVGLSLLGTIHNHRPQSCSPLGWSLARASGPPATHTSLPFWKSLDTQGPHGRLGKAPAPSQALCCVLPHLVCGPELAGIPEPRAACCAPASCVTMVSPWPARSKLDLAWDLPPSQRSRGKHLAAPGHSPLPPTLPEPRRAPGAGPDLQTAATWLRAPGLLHSLMDSRNGRGKGGRMRRTWRWFSGAHQGVRSGRGGWLPSLLAGQALCSLTAAGPGLGAQVLAPAGLPGVHTQHPQCPLQDLRSRQYSSGPLPWDPGDPSCSRETWDLPGEATPPMSSGTHTVPQTAGLRHGGCPQTPLASLTPARARGRQWGGLLLCGAAVSARGLRMELRWVRMDPGAGG